MHDIFLLHKLQKVDQLGKQDSDDIFTNSILTALDKIIKWAIRRMLKDEVQVFLILWKIILVRSDLFDLP